MESIAVLIFSSLVDLGEAFNLVLRENSLMPSFQVKVSKLDQIIWNKILCGVPSRCRRPSADVKVTRLFTSCSHHNDFKPTPPLPCSSLNWTLYNVDSALLPSYSINHSAWEDLDRFHRIKCLEEGSMFCTVRVQVCSWNLLTSIIHSIICLDCDFCMQINK